MAKTQKPVEVEEPKVEEPKESKGDINCFQGGVFIRAYNVKVHGKNAQKLAEGFVSKRADREIK